MSKGAFHPGMRPALRPDHGLYPRVEPMSSDRWLTYPNAAELLGMTPDSVRARARREHWGKMLNNEGKAIILVPLEAISDGIDATSSSPPPSRPKPPQNGILSEQLAEIADLRGRLEELRSTLHSERDERRAERADHAADQVADLAKQFAEAMMTAQGRIDALQVEKETIRSQKDGIITRLEKRLSAAQRVVDWSREHPLRRLWRLPPKTGMFGEG